MGNTTARGLVRVERPTWPCPAATCRRASRAGSGHERRVSPVADCRAGRPAERAGGPFHPDPSRRAGWRHGPHASAPATRPNRALPIQLLCPSIDPGCTPLGPTQSCWANPTFGQIHVRPFMRIITLLLLVTALTGCAGKHTAPVASSSAPQTTRSAVPAAPQTAPDSIAALVARLSATEGMWINGLYPIIDVSSTASTQQVLEQVFKKTGFDTGNVRTFQIIETREVQIPAAGFSGAFTAALVETNLGRKIVLLGRTSPSGNWSKWSRVYDA